MEFLVSLAQNGRICRVARRGAWSEQYGPHTSLRTRRQTGVHHHLGMEQIKDTDSCVINTASSCIYCLYHSMTTCFSTRIQPYLSL